MGCVEGNPGKSITIKLFQGSQTYKKEMQAYFIYNKYIIGSPAQFFDQKQSKYFDKLQIKLQQNWSQRQISNIEQLPIINFNSNDYLMIIDIQQKKASIITISRHQTLQYLNNTFKSIIKQIQQYFLSYQQQYIQLSNGTSSLASNSTLHQIENTHKKIKNKLEQISKVIESLVPKGGNNVQLPITNIMPNSDSYYQSFKWNPSFSKAYSINNQTVTLNSNKTSNSYQITSLQAIPASQVTKICFKILKYGNQLSNVTMGITTSDKRQNECNTGNEMQSSGYQAYPGDKKGGILYIDKQQVQRFNQDLGIEEGNQVIMIVDTKQYKITFINSKNPNKQFKYNLKKQHWKHKMLYPFVSMISPGSSIQIIKPR